MQNEEPSGHESVSIRPQSQIELVELPSIRQAIPEIEWRESPTAEAQSIVPSTGYFVRELLSPSIRDPSYRAPVLPAMLPRPTFESPSDKFRPASLLFPTSFEGPFLTSGRGNLSDNMAERRYTNSFYTPTSARNRSGPTIIPQSQSIEQPLFLYVRDLPDACEVGIVPERIKRKRKGNLPKEATDKLRAWLIAHLQHPYPTDEEKQALMEQTKLRIDQISNWFINARRRQLPAMTKNVQIEPDTQSAQSAPGDSPLLGPEQEISAKREDMIDVDFCVGRQIHESGLEN